MTDASTPVLSVDALSKRYGGIHALREVSMDVEQGEVLALLGKNGAGKSTLVKVLCGAVQPDAGVIRVGGEPVRIGSPLDAFKCGIVTVHQEPHVVPGLNVGENIMLGRWGSHGIVDGDRIVSESRKALARLGSSLDPREPTASLSIANWQMIEIARALTQEVRVLIMDEPTSALGKEDASSLVAILRSLAAEGVAIIYVSHRLDEIPRVADRITVLREGEVVETLDKRDTTPRTVIEAMIGREWRETAATKRAAGAVVEDEDSVLRVRNLEVPNRVYGVNLDVRKGEVVGLAGLVGAGRSELLRAIYGAIDCSGDVSVEGRLLTRRHPARMCRAGVSLLTDDRKREGLFLDLPVADNIALGNLGRVSRWGWISPRRRAETANSAIETLAIKTSGNEQNVQSLSGGNQQKVAIARCLAAGAKILMLDEPTRGVDVEAKFQIYQFLRSLARSGLSVIVAPSEFDELTQMCDRVVVMREGVVVGEFDGPDIEVQDVMAAAMADESEDTDNQATGPRAPAQAKG